MKDDFGKSLRVSDLIVSTLVSHGVDHFFILAGGNAMFLNDAIKISNVEFTAFHNEQAAAMAAEAYSRTTGKLAACVVTSGPGVSNLATGVLGAFLDSAAVFYIGGQAKSTELVSQEMPSGVRQFGTFEIPGIDLMKPICKRTHLLAIGDDPVQITSELIAISKSDRPGPVYLEVPLDVQGSQSAGSEMNLASGKTKAEISLELSCFLHDFLEAANASKSPLILAGYGVVASGGQELFRKFVEDFDFQVVTTQLAKQLLPYLSLNFVGHAGIRGDRAGNIAVYESDCLLILGCSLQQQTIGYDASQFAPNASIFLLDYEGSVSAKKLPIKYTKTIDESVVDFLNSALSLKRNPTTQTDSSEWKVRTLENKSNLAVMNEPHNLSGPRINLYEFVHRLSSFSEPRDVIVTDAGLCYYVMGQNFKIKDGQKYIVSGGLGAMGYALPAAIGASTSLRGRVLAVTGDGSLQMNVQELATLAKSRNNALIFVINNDGYASIRNSQRAFFGENLIGSSESSGVVMPKWSSIANAYNLPYFFATDPGNLEDLFQKLASFSGPAIIEILCHVDQQIMPMIASTKDENGKLISNPLHVMSPIFESDQNLPQMN